MQLYETGKRSRTNRYLTVITGRKLHKPNAHHQNPNSKKKNERDIQGAIKAVESATCSPWEVGYN